MSTPLDLSSLPSFQAPAPIAFRDEEIGSDYSEPTVIYFGSDEFEVDASARGKRSFADIIAQYAPTIGVTFDSSKMTLRKEVVGEGENPMVSFYTVATSGTFVLSSSSDSKGIV
jgi:hypothetical protein